MKLFQKQRNSYFKVLLCLGFSAIALALINIGLNENKTRHIVVSAITLLFFAPLAIFWLRLARSRAPIIELDETGIWTRSSIFQVGKIEWQDIQSAQLKYYSNQPSIAIKVRNSDKYYQRLPMFMRWLASLYRFFWQHVYLSCPV